MPDSSNDPNVVPALGLIVVVDDEDLVRRVIARQLIRAGYTVREAANGEEALAVLDSLGEEERALLRAALLDLSMPGLSGKRLLDEVNRKYENLPVVILSGHIEDESLLTGARAVLQKPILSAELLRVVREVTA
jgi:CheY-like chemotaxis protein